MDQKKDCGIVSNASTYRCSDSVGKIFTTPLAKVSSLVMMDSTNRGELVYSKLVAHIAKMTFRSPINRDGLAKCIVQHMVPSFCADSGLSSASVSSCNTLSSFCRSRSFLFLFVKVQPSSL